MNNVYSILNTIGRHGQYLRPAGVLRATAPHKANANRTVSGNENRGGFSHGACTVPTDPNVARARLSLRAMRDTKTEAADGSYSFTSFAVADFVVDGWSRVNSVFEARLTRQQYNQLLAQGLVPANADLSHNVLIDLRGLPLFPVIRFGVNYIARKRMLCLAESTLTYYEKVKREARKYFDKNNITFDGLAPKRVFTPSTATDTVTVEVPYTRVEYVIEGESFAVALDDGTYREKVGRGYVYTPEKYIELMKVLEATKTIVNALRPLVRIAEMSFLEHYDGETLVSGDVTVRRVITETSEKEYGIDKADADAFIAANPTAVIA
jgi:hypothetical protein